MRIVEEPFGRTSNGQSVSRFKLFNDQGVCVELLSYGATVSSVKLPDSKGGLVDVVLGLSTLREYESNEAYIGALIGRYANRIAGASFSLDGVKYILSQNEGSNQLHGGFNGLDKQVWSFRSIEEDGLVGVEFYTVLEDGLDGFPGELQLSVIISLNQDNQLRFDYRASTDKPTYVNLTHHGYFNLAGRYSGSCEEQRLWIDADYYTPVRADQTPTGELCPVTDTPFDFRHAKPLGRDSGSQPDEPRGFDHNWVLNKACGELRKIAELTDPGSGRRMSVSTTQPGLQCYTGQYLSIPARGEFPGYGARAGVALETQHFPDSPNQIEFPSALVRPDKPYQQSTVYQFDSVSLDSTGAVSES